ncbi:SNF2 helicase protein [Streptomyces sp. SLBN-118]|nr:SNF2 helicase protein [Streptomyces sp. SLBN-118]
MHTSLAATLSPVNQPPLAPSELAELARCAAVFLPGDPARTGRIALLPPDGGEPPASPGRVEPLTVVGDDVRPRSMRALVLPVREALPMLTRARSDADASPAAAFWGAATILALQLAARGLLLPGLTVTDRDAWRVGPLSPQDRERVRTLAASMPPAAHAVPLDAAGDPLLLPEPERLLCAFLDAVADGLPRTPAAPIAAGGPAFTAHEPQLLPDRHAWAADTAAGHDAGVRLSLRVELPGLVNWWFALGDQRLTRAELDQLAEASRPVVRLRDQWVLVDPEEARRARESQDRKLTPVDALGAVPTGSTEVDGRRVDVQASRWLKRLRDRLADPEGGLEIGQPEALAATLRDYQLRGLNWLKGMTSLGLGACLADDMGLGKTITLIFPVKSAC